MKRLKVCHIITLLELGGAQRNTLYTAQNLGRDLFEPLLICGKGGMLDREAETIEGLRAYFLPSLVRPVSPLKDFLSLLAIWRILLLEKPDIVHTHSSKAGILGRIAARLARVPVVIHTYHGFGFNDFQHKAVKSIFLLAEKLTAPLTDKFIAVAREDIAKGLKHGLGRPDKYILIRSGIDLKIFLHAAYDKAAVRNSLGIASGKKVVTTIGPFKPQKNLADFVKAAALTRKLAPDTVFLIAGDGEQRPALESLIRALDLRDSVRLLGWRDDTDRILAVTDVFAMTSLWEGLPRSILEAMASRLPVVANAVDGVKEIVKNGETGYLIEPGDINAFAQRVSELLVDRDKAEDMGIKARSSIDGQYDINFMVKQQEELYLSYFNTK